MKTSIIDSVALKATQIRAIAKNGMNHKKASKIGSIRRNLLRTAKKEIAPMINKPVFACDKTYHVAR